MALLDCFERTEMPLVEKEIERLFRTNVFNSSARNQERAAHERQYPALKGFQMEGRRFAKLEIEEQSPKNIVSRIENRMLIRKRLNVLPT